MIRDLIESDYYVRIDVFTKSSTVLAKKVASQFSFIFCLIVKLDSLLNLFFMIFAFYRRYHLVLVEAMVRALTRCDSMMDLVPFDALDFGSSH